MVSSEQDQNSENLATNSTHATNASGASSSVDMERVGERRDRRSRDRYGRERRERQERTPDEAAAVSEQSTSSQNQPNQPSGPYGATASESHSLNNSAHPNHDVQTKTHPHDSQRAEMPKVVPYDLPMDQLVQIAKSSGLEWVNSNPERIAQVQMIIASEPKPVHVPRPRPPLVVLDEGPLILVETRKDLSQIKIGI